MSVLHLISSGGVYGAETMLLNLASAQEKIGCRAALGVFANGPRPQLEIAQLARERGLRVEIFPCRGRFDRRPIQAIRETIEAQDISLIHAHGYKADLYGYFATRSPRIPFVSTCHLWTGSSRSVRLYEFIDALVLRRADKVVGVSDAIAKILSAAGISEDKISVIYNGTDMPPTDIASENLRQELGPTDKFIIGAVGRLEKQKGFEYLIEAAREVLQVFPNVVFVIAGEGSMRTELEDMISKHSMKSNFQLLGRRTNMASFYASLDLFVLPSIDEGMPMTLLEALAARRAAVATNVGAVSKLVINERTGLLIEPRKPAVLRDAMLRCLRDPSLTRRLGAQGEQFVRSSFSAEGMARSYVNIYRELMAKRGTQYAVSEEKI